MQLHVPLQHAISASARRCSPGPGVLPVGRRRPGAWPGKLARAAIMAGSQGADTPPIPIPDWPLRIAGITGIPGRPVPIPDLPAGPGDGDGPPASPIPIGDSAP